MFKKKKKEDPFKGWREEDDHETDLLGEQGPETYQYRGHELTKEQWEHLTNGPRGNRLAYPLPSGSFYRNDYPDEYVAFNATGTVPQYDLHLERPKAHNLDFDIEALWEKMYEHAMAVIVVCEWCGTPQAISNGTCMQCGGALPNPKPLGGKT